MNIRIKNNKNNSIFSTYIIFFNSSKHNYVLLNECCNCV